MAEATHEIIPYQPEHRDGVIGVLAHLWSNDLDSNSRHFAWKHEQNPFVDGVLGIVALSDGEVVGFRGYFADRVVVAERAHTVLFPGDTCVVPDHRRRGLSVAMGRRAMAEYSSRCSLMVNLSCSKSSLPGYLRMRFHPLTPKFFVSRATIPGLARYLSASRERQPRPERVQCGRFGDVVVSDEPQPEAMASIAAACDARQRRIRLCRDRAFYAWRYSSPSSRYLFYYAMGDRGTLGFVVLGISPNHRRGYILDYAENEPGALAEIIAMIVSAKHFDVLSILGFGLDDAFAATLRRLRFRTGSVLRVIERARRGELPVLIRPVAESFSTEDFMLEGIDARDPDSWDLKPVASDAA